MPNNKLQAQFIRSIYGNRYATYVCPKCGTYLDKYFGKTKPHQCKACGQPVTYKT